ncbi:MAG: hypothetical protein J2P48_06325 [Alphaproteobacteria bacterium]|nr:hypothetical protein [Alphaproteobacteria bacterium]
MPGDVLYPSQGLFYFKVADTPLISAIFHAMTGWPRFASPIPPVSKSSLAVFLPARRAAYQRQPLGAMIDRHHRARARDHEDRGDIAGGRPS